MPLYKLTYFPKMVGTIENVVTILPETLVISEISSEESEFKDGELQTDFVDLDNDPDQRHQFYLMEKLDNSPIRALYYFYDNLLETVRFEQGMFNEQGMFKLIYVPEGVYTTDNATHGNSKLEYISNNQWSIDLISNTKGIDSGVIQTISKEGNVEKYYAHKSGENLLEAFVKFYDEVSKLNG